MIPPLLETDQIYCYDAAGRVIPCAGSGQDASRAKQRALPRAGRGGVSGHGLEGSPRCSGPECDPGRDGLCCPPRFEILGETVKDAWTGAIWSRTANAADFPLTWDEARAFVSGMAAEGAHGLTGWQLPPRWLLFSLISHQRTTPALPAGHPFRDVFSGYYWTADTCHRLPEQAWHVHVGGGRVPKAGKSEGALVWPVCLPGSAPERAGEAGAKASEPARFALEGGCVLDTLTGLVWSRDADPARKALSWPDALSLAAQLDRDAWQGGGGWRMPNIRELESLMDLAADSPALTPGHPFVNVPEVCWSSTTSVYEPRYAWALYTRDGMVGVGFKAEAGFSLWPVRDR